MMECTLLWFVVCRLLTSTYHIASPGDDPEDDWACYRLNICKRSWDDDWYHWTMTDILAIKTGDLHTNFEKKLCTKLRASGVANFANAKDCAFNTFENPGSFNTRATKENAYEAANGKIMEADISLLGLDKELNKEEMKLLESFVFEAHNEAFLSTGYLLNDFEVSSSIMAGTYASCSSCAH